MLDTLLVVKTLRSLAINGMLTELILAKILQRRNVVHF